MTENTSQTTQLADAVALAAQKHRTQTDKQGAPYLYHVLSVWNRVKGMGIQTEITALLHDTVEDTDLTLGEIEEAFGADVARAVDALSKRPGEDYFDDFLPRVVQNPIAVKVKKADISDNLQKSSTLTDESQRERFAAKYTKALQFLDRMEG